MVYAVAKGLIIKRLATAYSTYRGLTEMGNRKIQSKHGWNTNLKCQKDGSWNHSSLFSFSPPAFSLHFKQLCLYVSNHSHK